MSDAIIDGFTIGRADDGALAAAFALLPALAVPDAVILVARDSAGALAGAGGLIWRGWGQPAGFPAWVHTLPDRRRHGVGRALMAALAREARGEMPALVSAQPISRDSDAARFAAAIGAREGQSHHYFEMRSAGFHAEMRRLVARLQPQVPSDARDEALTEENAAGVVALVTNDFNVLPPAAEAIVRRALVEDPATSAVDRLRTCVIRVGDAVAGVLVARRRPDQPGTDIAFRVVAPEFRGRWINALLMERFLSRLSPQGHDEIVTFDCVDSNADTLKLAVRTEARTVRIDSTWAYATAAAVA